MIVRFNIFFVTACLASMGFVQHQVQAYDPVCSDSESYYESESDKEPSNQLGAVQDTCATKRTEEKPSEWRAALRKAIEVLAIGTGLAALCGLAVFLLGHIKGIEFRVHSYYPMPVPAYMIYPYYPFGYTYYETPGIVPSIVFKI
jgi:hypothetical protein